jgi:hypothetical protein
MSDSQIVLLSIIGYIAVIGASVAICERGKLEEGDTVVASILWPIALPPLFCYWFFTWILKR